MFGRILACSGLILFAAGAKAADTLPGLSSPMVNRGIYRDGEVQRLKGHFGDWTVTCDEIVSLKQRYCSLRSIALRNDNRRAAVVDLSTGDNGQPAALVHLPLGVSVGYGVDVETGALSTPRGKNAGRKLGIVSCSTNECLAVWSLNAGDIEALTAGTPIRLTACSPDPEHEVAAGDLTAGRCEVKSAGTLSAKGFRDAIHAATL